MNNMSHKSSKIPKPTHKSYTKMTAEIYDAIYAFKEYEVEAKKLNEFIKIYKKTSGSDLLDVACGTGLHLQYLINSYSITGVDKSAEQLRVAQKRLPTLHFIQGDMRDFNLGKKFDVVVCLFSSIGYVHPLSEMEKAIENMAKHLKNGGVLIIEPWLLPGSFNPSKPPYIQKGEVGNDISVVRTTYNIGIRGNLSIMDMHHLIKGPDVHDEFTEHHELASYSKTEFKSTFEKAGLEFTFDQKGLTGRGVYIGIKI